MRVSISYATTNPYLYQPMSLPIQVTANPCPTDCCHYQPVSLPTQVTTNPCHYQPMSLPTHVTTNPCPANRCHYQLMSLPTHVTITLCHYEHMSLPYVTIIHFTIIPCHYRPHDNGSPCKWHGKLQSMINNSYNWETECILQRNLKLAKMIKTLGITDREMK